MTKDKILMHRLTIKFYGKHENEKPQHGYLSVHDLEYAEIHQIQKTKNNELVEGVGMPLCIESLNNIAKAIKPKKQTKFKQNFFKRFIVHENLSVNCVSWIIPERKIVIEVKVGKETRRIKHTQKPILIVYNKKKISMMYLHSYDLYSPECVVSPVHYPNVYNSDICMGSIKVPDFKMYLKNCNEFFAEIENAIFDGYFTCAESEIDNLEKLLKSSKLNNKNTIKYEAFLQQTT